MHRSAAHWPPLALTVAQRSMTIHYLKSPYTCSACEMRLPDEMPKPYEVLKPYELPMPLAPFVELANGNKVVPQHYLQFTQSLGSVQEIIHDIDTLALTPIFAAQDEQGLYIQVGLIGRENYARGATTRPQKLVYGRKWRIDRDTPTSEIIQTAFLAVKKAREHEMRELLTLQIAHTGQHSAPFSTHQDLPVMASNRDLLGGSAQAAESIEAIHDLLQRVRFGERTFNVLDVLVRDSSIIVDLRLGPAPLARQQEADLAEFDDWRVSLILESFNPAHFLFSLMDTIIAKSDAMVAEEFAYKGFRRFSREHHPELIASLSTALRPYGRDLANTKFAAGFKSLNYYTDASRVPRLGRGLLAQKNRAIIRAVDDLSGHMPPDLDVDAAEFTAQKSAR